jgi:ElaB/YqjD/DUF883 family membrane-anchored ribosome-binding protein
MNQDTMRDLGIEAEREIAELRAKVDRLMNERLAPTLGAMASEAEAAAQAATARVRHEADRLSGAVRENPLVSIGLAALAGYVLATLTRR